MKYLCGKRCFFEKDRNERGSERIVDFDLVNEIEHDQEPERLFFDDLLEFDDLVRVFLITWDERRRILY